MTDHNATFAAFFDLGKDILSAAVNRATNVILCQIGNALDATPDSDSAELWGPPGYYAIPANPTPGQPSCQCITLKQSDHDVIIGTRDTRDAQIYGKLKPGERCLAGGFPSQNRILQKANGDTYIYTLLGNVAGGQSLAFHQGSDGSGTWQGAGWRIANGADGGMSFTNGACGITMSPAGTVTIFGTIVQVQASGVAQISGDKMTALGPVPTLATPCAIGPSGAAVSTNVMISPTGK